jgi:hypothetical protein
LMAATNGGGPFIHPAGVDSEGILLGDRNSKPPALGTHDTGLPQGEIRRLTK